MNWPILIISLTVIGVFAACEFYIRRLEQESDDGSN